jgi:multimeric flavodoxin WrbA
VLAHDQIILATPIYWYAVSAAMKNFLDRLSDLLELPDLLPEGRRSVHDAEAVRFAALFKAAARQI